MSTLIVNPIGSKNLMFRRTTNRYARKGTLSSNRGYLKVSRSIAPKTRGQFTARPA
jgi:hypothetical protein